MGWGRTLLLGDVGNRLDIEDCEKDISLLRKRLKNKHRVDLDQDAELKSLRQEVDELKLCVSSLTRILTAKGVVDETELTRFAQVIDKDDDIVQFLDEDSQ